VKHSTDETELFEFLIHPPAGWVRYKRDKFGITGAQLAAKMGVSKQRISALEKAELTGAASLKTMRQAAAALGCDFVYALIPKDSLQPDAQDVQPLDPLQCMQSPQGDAQITELCKRFQIKHLGLYGSAARAELHDDSDINLLAEFQKTEGTNLQPVDEMEIQFARLFGRKTTIMSPAILDDPKYVDAIIADLKLLHVS